jgi:hypothetical protein
MTAAAAAAIREAAPIAAVRGLLRAALLPPSQTPRDGIGPGLLLLLLLEEEVDCGRAGAAELQQLHKGHVLVRVAAQVALVVVVPPIHLVQRQEVQLHRTNRRSDKNTAGEGYDTIGLG